MLVVNGFVDGRAMYVTFLRHHGLEVRGAAQPESAVHVLNRFRPDIIVTDLVFPCGRLDGPAFISAVRRRHDLPEQTIIVVSGFTRQTDERRARDAGADAFLIKPCLPEQLLLHVRRAFESRHTVDATT